MIKANVGYGKGHYIARVQGHAEFAPKGQDIVCAGVSALTMALHKAVTDTVGENDAERYSIKIDEGQFGILVADVCDSKKEEMLDAFFSMFDKGISQIEKEYPGYISVLRIIFSDQDEYDGTSEQTMEIE